VDVLVENGSPVCTAIRPHPGGPPLTSVRLGVGNLVRDVAREIAVSPTGEHFNGVPIAGRVVNPDERAELDAAIQQRRQGARVPDAFLEKVAAIYRRALEQGEPPTETVRKVMPGSRSSAGRWVEEARRRGYLPPTTSGRARAY